MMTCDEDRSQTVSYSMTRTGTNGAAACRTTVIFYTEAIDAVIDTGAAKTLISSKAFDKLSIHDKTLKPTNLVLRSASGNNCKILGETVY